MREEYRRKLIEEEKQKVSQQKRKVAVEQMREEYISNRQKITDDIKDNNIIPRGPPGLIQSNSDKFQEIRTRNSVDSADMDMLSSELGNNSKTSETHIPKNTIKKIVKDITTKKISDDAVILITAYINEVLFELSVEINDLVNLQNSSIISTKYVQFYLDKIRKKKT